MTIRIAYLADHEAFLPQVAAWQHAQFGYLNPSGTLAQREAKLRESLARDRLPIAFVPLADDGALAGSASLLPSTLTHQHLTPWLSSVFVPPERRGAGIAGKLSLHAADIAASLGFANVYLFTPKSESLYARLGWKTFDAVDHNGTRLTLMAKSMIVV